MAPKAYLYDQAGQRFRPLSGGADILLGQTYPPNYGPVGSYEPAAGTSGCPSWASLTTYAGSMLVTTPGAVIEDMDIWGRLRIRAAGVTVRRCIVRGIAGASGNTQCIAANDPEVSGLVIEDVTLDPQEPSRYINGIEGHDFTMRRCDIANVVDYFGLYNTAAGSSYSLNVTIEANYCHDMTYWTPDSAHSSDNQSHNDGVQIHGGKGATIRGNSFHSYYGPKGSHQPSNTASPTPSGASNPSLSCVLFNVNVGTTGNHIIEDNWMRGAYLPINCGGAPGVDLGRIWRNKFSGDSYQPGSGDVWTINLRADQTCDTGDGTANQNVFLDGTPVTVRRNA